ncbi:interferon regulatory factor 7 [Erpetoichthys calabaricus]|uniref:interferon regulatory factor 7 n=1 Tax=Erpetoichthys calabaricus TaxID=27687 RepID=UPI002234B1E6|nr:interferon regulatory factor 7 [Erpetoichthys calabaricus]
MQSNRTRPQFSCWLIEQINSNGYPGLFWLDRVTFRIPWKHISRMDCSEEDCAIFKAWAVTSGKIHEYPESKAKWKTNFRCILRSLKCFRKIEDHSKDSDDPHKVYQIVEDINVENAELPQSNIHAHLPLPMNFQMVSPAVNQPVNTEQETFQQFGMLNLSNTQAELPIGVSSQNASPILFSEQFAESTPANPVHVPQNEMPQEPATSQYAMGNFQFAGPSPHDMEVTITYRGRTVLQTTVCGPKVQLHYNCEGNAIVTQSHVCFPSTDGMTDRKQIQSTNTLLDNIQRGLLLEIRNKSIYATRLSKCCIYMSDPSAPPNTIGGSFKLSQNEEVQLLDFSKYFLEIKNYCDHEGHSPDYTIYLCFGEKYPDNKPNERKLIIVKIVPLMYKYLYEVAQLSGASSLRSNPSLQISCDPENDLYNLIQSYLNSGMDFTNY